ncbi:hydroxyacid dehydrogenase [Amaricoccus tamworthensis]|uniref:hydroxyacid dehydrogenase n=1 Tax=Amaricoccus tamworthensis TaxID=57002 RepID=UPI003C7E46E0
MRYSSLIQLERPQFEIHFPLACRDHALSRLSDVTNLLHPEPVADLRGPEAAPHLSEVEILFTGWRSNAIDAEIRRRMPRLKLVAHLAGTVKGVLNPSFDGTGLTVISAADANAKPVAEFTIAHVLLHLKRVLEWRKLYRRERSGIATRSAVLAGPVGNTGRTVGIIGASRIGRRVIADLQQRGITILLHDPFVSGQDADAMGVRLVPLDELLRESDVVSLHQPLLPETERSFGAKQFAKMRDGALLINTARGRIIDGSALENAMADGRLFAVLDVTDPEPLPDDSRLWEMPNVTITPHVAGSFGCEVCDMTGMVLDDVERFTRGEALRHEVLFADWERVA